MPAVDVSRHRWIRLAFDQVSVRIGSQAGGCCRAQVLLENAAKALSNVMTDFQVARPFTLLVPDNLDEFIVQWAGHLVAASEGPL